MSAAAWVASGTGVPVASNTTTGVPVCTSDNAVVVSVAVGTAGVSVDATLVSVADGNASVGAALVSVTAAGAVAGAGVPAGATDVSAGGTELLAGAAEGSAEAGADVPTGDEDCVLSVVDDGSPEAGAAGADGVPSSARAIMGWTALSTSASRMARPKRLVRKYFLTMSFPFLKQEPGLKPRLAKFECIAFSGLAIVVTCVTVDPLALRPRLSPGLPLSIFSFN